MPRHRRLPTLLALTLVSLAALLGRGRGDDAPAPAPTPDPQTLVGTWKVDLRPKPGAPDYFQEFVVRGVEDSTLTGTFYGTELSDGRLNTDWGAVHFAFTTRDASGLYAHSGVLRDGRLEGRSHALGRGFLSIWTATRAPAP